MVGGVDAHACVVGWDEGGILRIGISAMRAMRGKGDCFINVV